MVSRIEKPICHLTLANGYRGGERQAELLIRELAARGHAQRLVVRRGHSLVARCRDIEGLEICEIAANLVAAGLATRGCSIAHSHEGRTIYAGLIGKMVYGVPYVITRRVVRSHSKSFFSDQAYRRAAAVVAVSRAAADDLNERHTTLRPAVISDAVADFKANAAEVERIREQRPGKVLIGHIGAYHHSHKGQLTIIEVARMAATRHPDWHFVLCGDGRDRTLFEREIGDLANIELAGWVENVGDYLAAFDLFLYPSLHEALGSTLLDAMQFGLPVVATNVGGIPDVIGDGLNGVLVEPEDAEQLSAAIETLLSDEEKLAQIRARNAEKSLSYSAARMADDYETLYREILG